MSLCVCHIRVLFLIDATSAEVIANYDVVLPVITHKEGTGVRHSPMASLNFFLLT